MQTTNKRILQILGGLLATVCLSTATFGQSADALIDKLVDKGVLTTEEATILREEADKDFRRAYSVKSGLPEWVTSLRMNGDVRLRYENFNYANDMAAPGAAATVDRHRFRYRMRFGVTAGFWDNLEAGFRLTSSEASGAGGDPISGNTTFSGNAGKKLVYLDLVYGKWTALNNPDWTLTLTGGKMENPFVFSDMTFDKDYTPEGGALSLTRRLSDVHSLNLIGGGFVLNELSGVSDDAYLFGTQLRWDALWNLHWQSSLGASWFSIMGNDNLATASVPNVNRGNTRNAGGYLQNNYNPFMFDASITHTLEKFWRYSSPFPIRVDADYIHNPVVNKDNYGWSAGITLGKAGKRGLWEIGYRYKYLGADAWYEEFVDSDFGGFYGSYPPGLGAATFGGLGYGAGTNVRGHIIKLAYSPFDSTTLAVSYFLTDLINGYRAAGAKDESNVGRLQVDVSWKF